MSVMPTDEESRQLYRPIAIALGELTYNWNLLQEHLCRLFAVVMNENNTDDEDAEDEDELTQHKKNADRDAAIASSPAYAIWHSTPNDYAQRSMLRAAAECIKDQQYGKEIIWLLDQIDKSLRNKRNDALHAPLVISSTVSLGAPPTPAEVTPFTLTKNPRAMNLVGKNLLEELVWYRQTASVLIIHALDLIAVRNPWQPRPLPERPQLPSRGQQTKDMETLLGSVHKES